MTSQHSYLENYLAGRHEPSSEAATDTDSVRIQLSLSLLAELIGEGRVCAAQLRCLDLESQRAVKGLCLRCCQDRLNAGTDSVALLSLEEALQDRNED